MKPLEFFTSVGVPSGGSCTRTIEGENRTKIGDFIFIGYVPKSTTYRFLVRKVKILDRHKNKNMIIVKLYQVLE